MRSNTHRVLALVRQLFDNRRRESSAADQISRALKLQPGSANSVSSRHPERNTEQMAQKLRAAGVPVTLTIYARASHYTLIGAFARPLRSLEPVLGDVVGFVRGDPAAP